MKRPMKRLVYLNEVKWCEPSKAAPEYQIHSGSSNNPKMVGYKTIAMSRQIKSNKEIVQAYNWLRKNMFHPIMTETKSGNIRIMYFKKWGK